MPFPHDVDEMLRWALGPERKPAEFLKRVAEIRLKRERGAGASAAQDHIHDPVWKAFQESRANATTKDASAQIQDLEEHLAFADFALRDARARGDEHAQKKYTDEVIKFSKAVKEQKLLADRLGLESGDLLSREIVELFIAAHAYWTMRTVDLALDSLSRKLVNLSFPEEARRILEPELLSARFVSGYARATQVASKSALPHWAFDKIRDTVDNFIEHGAEHFDATLGLTPPPLDLTDGGGI